MWIFLLFLTIPLVEIGLFVQVGGLIGLWPTLGVVILTAVLGTWLVRSQGLMALNELRSSFAGRGDPTRALADGAMILFSGALLLTPGFFTDAVGFALLIPAFRLFLFNYLRSRIKVQGFRSHVTMQDSQTHRRPGGQGGHSQHTTHEDVIEGDWQDEDPDSDAPSNSNGELGAGIGENRSGWTRH
ncbi:FxsA family protein [Candidatus Halocynthiibacter alkanivorans]|uniref:FxsA family protein n=1 Tax=Candidatus Halocynthiibacter alkanivorans TaxID=2267619 RepID=UPI000DF186FB|nr:FxsA family protein [Candidatus Halocynthiibacter alkanivorans]